MTRRAASQRPQSVDLFRRWGTMSISNRAVPVDDLARLAATHRILEIEGHGDMTQGHLSLRDPEGDGFWLKRHGIGIGEVIDADDFILLDFDGKKIHGKGGRHSEWPIHSEILRRRRDINVVAHTHPFYACVFSATKEPLRPLTLDGARLPTATIHYKSSTELICTAALGRDLAQALGDSYTMLMGNHGATFAGRSIEHALVMGISLERACHAQLVIGASGFASECPDTATNDQRKSSIAENQAGGLDGFYRQTWDYYRRKLAWAEARNPSGIRGYFRTI
jgi:L-fuculose-phosphate aldolase